MADNLSKTEWDAGAEVASDDIGTIHYPRVKVTWGVDGTANDASAATALPVAFLRDAATHVDTTSTPLGISATYTTPTFDSLTTGTFVTHHMYADQAGTHIFEQSTDGTNWEIEDQDTVLAATPKTEAHIVTARYHRARFVNGGVAQTVFRHQLITRVVGAPHAVGIMESMNVILGDKTHNTSAPTAEAHEVIGAVAKAAAPTYTEGAVVMPRVTLSGDQAVTLDGESVSVTNAGTFATQATLAAETTKVIGTINVAAAQTIAVTNAGTFATQSVAAGDVAHDGVDSGNPVGIGGIARTAFASVSAALDRVKAMFDLQGRQIVRANAPRGLRIKATITLTSTTETTLLAAAASTFHDLTKIIISNTSATAVRVDFRDTTAGTVMFSIYAPAGQAVGFTDSNDPIEQAAVNTNWTAQLSAAVTDVRIFAQAVKNI